MKNTVRILMALTLIASLSACVVAPYPTYVEPGVAVVVPPPVYAAPIYAPAYFGVGVEYRARGWRHH